MIKFSYCAVNNIIERRGFPAGTNINPYPVLKKKLKHLIVLSTCKISWVSHSSPIMALVNKMKGNHNLSILGSEREREKKRIS